MSHFHNNEFRNTHNQINRKRFQHDIGEANNTLNIKTQNIRNIKIRSHAGNAKRLRANSDNFAQSKLNIDRVLDLLSKEQLVHLLKKSMDIEPKLESFVLEEIDCKFFNNSKFKMLQNKIISNFNKLVSQIPFERSNTSVSSQSEYSNNEESSDASTEETSKVIDYSYITVNDYSFEKVKSSYLNFLNLIYDYNEYALKFCSLNMEIWSLLETSLKILICLPKLENKVNNYYKSYLIEKLDVLVSNVLLEQTNGNDRDIINNIEMIINMNRSKFNFLISSLGVEKFFNINNFINNLCGTYIPNTASSTENEQTTNSSSGMDYIKNFLQEQNNASKSMANKFNNGNLEFHDSILITGDTDDRYLNRSEINSNNGNNADALDNLSTELAMGSASVYLT
ncbi:hypothetical protein FOG51_00283 [Hanseniaspora uvarum]|nr:hypothetical protein FOG51_00283 [Hanseniaspora uvarum]KAF0275943.1 hypothetical protein FOG50_03208 [Hanseniaspora uvarum]